MNKLLEEAISNTLSGKIHLIEEAKKLKMKQTAYAIYDTKRKGFYVRGTSRSAPKPTNVIDATIWPEASQPQAMLEYEYGKDPAVLAEFKIVTLSIGISE